MAGMTSLYRGMDRAALDAAYNNGAAVADSDRFIGNSLAARATWKGDPNIGHKDQPIMLRVQLKQARLFGFEFQD